MPEYRMPHVELGMPVIWYHEGNKQNPHAAIVVGVGRDAIDVNYFEPDKSVHMAASGVPHVDRPDVNNVTRRENGTWAHFPWMKFVLRTYIKQEPQEKVPAPQTNF